MPETYDVLVVGGGHNGLTAAISLARDGFSVGLAEARAQAGGCAVTSRVLAGAAWHSPHANCFLYSDLIPSPFHPAELGIELIAPEAQLGVAFADGRRPVILHRTDMLKATRASLAAYSRKDAEVYVELKLRSEQLGEILQRGLYSPPATEWFAAQRAEIVRAYGATCGPATLGQRSARELIDSLFLTPEIRLLFYALALETGLDLEAAGSDMGFLAFSLWIAGRWRVPRGGMKVYSDALVRLAKSEGVAVQTSRPIVRVLAESGRAFGVCDQSGAEIRASVAVIAATPILTVFDHLLEPHEVSTREAAEVELFRQATAPSIGVSVFSLARAPQYKSARHDSQIDRCLKTVIGYEGPSDLVEHQAQSAAGLLPRPAGVARVHSLWDSRLSVGGGHVAAIDSSLPPRGALDDETWRSVEEAFPEALFATWSESLLRDPPLTPVMMASEATPDFERRMLMRLGDEQYRTSVRGLYLAGPGVYPGGGVHGACGINAASVLKRDHAAGR